MAVHGARHGVSTATLSSLQPLASSSHSCSRFSLLGSKQLSSCFCLAQLPCRCFTSAALQRAVREIPWKSRHDILREREKPVYASECRGTPRREYSKNVIDGVRVQPTFNPFVKLNKAKRYVLDNWPSRNWDDWSPYRCYVRGSRRRYNIPQDLLPYKDELGEWHPPRLSARYQADVKKQYLMNNLPWVWQKDFYEGKMHFGDREPLGPKAWYRKAYREERVKEAMRKMDDLVLDYRQENRDRRRYNWFEKVVHDFAGEEIATQFIRKRKEPKL
uniref:BIR protein n=1 Tax=Neospora caninum (strain Liverpool) TaxID=572307 RepID=A0A0F7UKC3_NEOCL|nr:TPA: BIR protein [Neospora caninum Liverpool]